MILYNEKQLECIKHPIAPLMIIAGAGTGKTTTIIGRIAYFINERNIKPENILALTYTVKAAKYLSDSIEKIIGKKSKNIVSSNFHSFAVNHILNYYKYLGYSSSPQLIESNESRYIIKKLISKNLSTFISTEYKKDNQLACQKIPKIFDRFRDELITDDYLIEKRDKLLEINNVDERSKQLIDCINLYFIYQEYKKKNSWIDFGDMITNFWMLLNSDSILDEIQSVTKHVFVDEYQDNNYALSQIIKKLSSHNSSVTVVGDDDQSIYSFRGANVLGFDEFKEYFKKNDKYNEIILDINYRSPQSVLNFSNEIVKNNSFRYKSKALTSNKEINSDIIMYSGNRDMQLTKILDIVKIHIKNGVIPSEICILTRSGINAITVSNYLNNFKVKNSYKSGKLFDNDSAKDFISYVNILLKGKFLQIGLYRLLSKSKYKSILTNQGALSKIFMNNKYFESKYDIKYDNKLIEYFNVEIDRIKENEIINSYINFSNKFFLKNHDINALELLDAILKKYDLLNKKLTGNICDYLNTIFELNDIYIEQNISKNDSVSIMTVHQSKGMEFKYVMVPFLSSGSFPSRNFTSEHLEDIPKEWLRNTMLQEIDKIEEERRIFHVASTRTKEHLYLFAPEKRKSKFFDEIDINTYRNEILIENKYAIEEKPSFDFTYTDKINLIFSASSLSLYESCPLSFKYRKIDRINLKQTTPAALLGMYVHKVLEIIYSKKYCDINSIRNIINQIWKDRDFDNIYQSIEYKKEAEDIISNYISNNPISSKTKFFIEEEISINISKNKYIGKIDRIDVLENEDIKILDYKTSKKKKTTKAVQKDLQLAYYSYLIMNSNEKKFYSKLPISSSLEFVRHFDDPTISVQFTNSDMFDIKERIENITKSVLSNKFQPEKNSLCYSCEYKRLLCPLHK